MARKIEPHVPSSTRRFRVLKELRDNDLFAGILMTPVLPFLTDTEDNIREMVARSHDANANFIYTKMGMNLRTNQRTYYYKKLDELYPGLSSDYEAVYGNKYVCSSLQYRHLMELFLNLCHQNDILTEMEDIISSYKKVIPMNEQISLFEF